MTHRLLNQLTENQFNFKSKVHMKTSRTPQHFYM